MKTIPLTRGLFTVVTNADFKRFGHLNWFAQANSCNGQFRAARGRYGAGGKRETVYLHREIMGAGPDDLVDHKDRNPLNNRRRNLRLCKHGQNAANCLARANNVSGFKGVFRLEENKKWMARVRVNGKGIYLGSFERAEDAARVYDRAAKKYFGEFSRLNFPR